MNRGSIILIILQFGKRTLGLIMPLPIPSPMPAEGFPEAICFFLSRGGISFAEILDRVFFLAPNHEVGIGMLRFRMIGFHSEDPI